MVEGLGFKVLIQPRLRHDRIHEPECRHVTHTSQKRMTPHARHPSGSSLLFSRLSSLLSSPLLSSPLLSSPLLSSPLLSLPLRSSQGKRQRHCPKQARSKLSSRGWLRCLRIHPDTQTGRMRMVRPAPLRIYQITPLCLRPYVTSLQPLV